MTVLPAGAVCLGSSPDGQKNSTSKINFAKPIGCAYICNRTASYLKIMRRDIFQAIADPTRRAILVLIAVQAMNPNAIAEHFDVTRQSISKHLRILSECDLLAQKHEGREIFYELKIDKMKEIDTWLAQFRKIMEERFQQLDQVLFTIKNNKK
jgi:DNA-binding transcriptional ArsR family regulator